MILHWLNVEIWGPMWPNMFAPSAITLTAIAFAHFKAKWHRESLHVERLAVAAASQQELLDQAEAHHQAATAQREKHQQDLLDRADAHHEAQLAAVAQVNAGSAPRPPRDIPVKGIPETQRKRGERT